MQRFSRLPDVWLPIAATILGGLLAMPATAEVDSRLARLSSANQAVAQRMVEFIEQMDRKYFARVQALNGEVGAAAQAETLERETDDSVYTVRVVRGPVVEKFGRMVAEGKKTQPGRREGELVWSRFYSLDIHPKTSLAGMLHATVVLQFYADGSGFAGGWLGVMNGTRVDEDMQLLRNVVDEHFASYDKKPDLYRQLIVKGTDETISEFRRRPDPSGVSFYGPPLFRSDVARSYELIETLFEKFTDAYLSVVVKRAGAVVTADDVAQQDAMRKRWLVDQLYSDPFASALVPFEVWSLANVPPTIKF